MNLIIRPIRETDATSVCHLSAQLGYSISIEDTLTNIKLVRKQKDHIAFAAVENNIVIGWVHAFKTITIESLPFVELAGLVVDETYRGKGIGKALVHSIKAWSTGQNIFTLRVRSNVKRNEAHRFYLSKGFHEIKEQKVFSLDLK